MKKWVCLLLCLCLVLSHAALADVEVPTREMPQE